MNTEIKKYPIADSIGFSSRRGVRVLSNMDDSCKLYYQGVDYRWDSDEVRKRKRQQYY